MPKQTAELTEEQLDEKVHLHLYCSMRLRLLVIEYAAREGVPLSEGGTQLVAKALGRPELGVVPRQHLGRKIGGSNAGGAKKGRGRK